jgi:hypothetical protein
MFYPSAAPLSGFVAAISSLADNSFKPLRTDTVEHVGCRYLEGIGDANSRRTKLQHGTHDFTALDQR